MSYFIQQLVNSAAMACVLLFMFEFNITAFKTMWRISTHPLTWGISTNENTVPDDEACDSFDEACAAFDEACDEFDEVCDAFDGD